MDIIIRRAEVSDAEDLIEYINKVGGETDNLSYGADTFKISIKKEERFIERFCRGERDIMLIALDGEKIVANASLEASRARRYSHRSELSITVLKEYWSMGIGSRLMEEMISFARAVGTEIIYLEARADNERAISLYKKLGFEENCKFEKFFKIGDKYFDAVLMTLYL